MADLLGRKLTPIQAAVVAAVNRPGGEDEGNICFRIKRPLHVTTRIINRLTEMGIVRYGWRDMTAGYSLTNAARDAIGNDWADNG